MAPDYKIRPFRSSDTDQLIELWQQVLPATQTWNDPVETLGRKLQRADGLVWVARRHEEIVGAVMAGYDGIRGWIYSLAVHPQHRKIGIGRKLVDSAESALIALGCPKVNLQVRATNQSVIEFYRRCGYAVEDRASLGKPLSDFPASTDMPKQTSGPCDYHIVEELSDKHVVELHELIQAQWWGKNRSLEDVKKMVEKTSLMIGLVEHSSNRLVGYCRTLTDFTFRATIYDVMVERSLQGQGLGKRLMDEICSHPQLRNVSLIYLACEPHLYPFYQQWGFRTYEGRAQWMLKVQREE
ncbi:MAG: GNAT family acetyltransferase [Planctomycetales bacterium]|nr:GNAT family acetyltransferase [Planctomycetales bacterium]